MMLFAAGGFFFEMFCTWMIGFALLFAAIRAFKK